MHLLLLLHSTHLWHSAHPPPPPLPLCVPTCRPPGNATLHRHLLLTTAAALATNNDQEQQITSPNDSLCPSLPITGSHQPLQRPHHPPPYPSHPLPHPHLLTQLADLPLLGDGTLTHNAGSPEAIPLAHHPHHDCHHCPIDLSRYEQLDNSIEPLTSSSPTTIHPVTPNPQPDTSPVPPNVSTPPNDIPFHPNPDEDTSPFAQEWSEHLRSTTTFEEFANACSDYTTAAVTDGRLLASQLPGIQRNQQPPDRRPLNRFPNPNRRHLPYNPCEASRLQFIPPLQETCHMPNPKGQLHLLYWNQDRCSQLLPTNVPTDHYQHRQPLTLPSKTRAIYSYRRVHTGSFLQPGNPPTTGLDEQLCPWPRPC